MAENERGIVYSEPVKAGKRIYYFDVKETRNGEKFLTITESKKIVEGGDAPTPQFTFQKHKIFLYKEDYEKFLTALQKTVEIAKGAPIPEPVDDPELSADETSEEEPSSEGGLDINFDF